ncbi:MAG: alkaline phosphatase D family protein [Pseudomonadota bacterium]
MTHPILPIFAVALLLSTTACGTIREDVPKGPLARVLFPDPETADEALESYYQTIPNDALPIAPEGVPLPVSDAVLTKILLGSCNDEEQASPALARLAQEDADLFIMMGDNVYGDRNGSTYVTNDAELTELRDAFAELGSRAEFQSVRAKHPMMVAWDDHDYGANDAGRSFAFRRFAERIHERFWGLDDQDVGNWDGTYYARSFGPEGQRVQIIMLDTRFFRSNLKGTDEYGAPGKERYIPATDPHQDMLGDDQWTWLSNELRKPADLRLIISSIQILPTTHGWESWDKLPLERQRLFDLIDRIGADNIVFASGDRHAAFLYEDAEAMSYPAYEITTSSLNVPIREENEEIDARQIGSGFGPANYGEITMDWNAGEVSLSVRDESGEIANQVIIDLEALKN